MKKPNQSWQDQVKKSGSKYFKLSWCGKKHKFLNDSLHPRFITDAI